MRRHCVLSSLFLFLPLLLVVNSSGATEQVLYRFTGSTDGAFPSSTLLMDRAGNLYGTASEGGNPSDCALDATRGCGVVFELSLSNGQWQEKVLYAFQGSPDGSFPSGNLVFDSSGNLFGTTSEGGTGTACAGRGCGTVFELSPSNGGWKEAVLYNFQSQPDGAFPTGLTFDSSGNLFGITTAAGANGRGTVYELSPPQRGGAWTEKVIYSFSTFETQPNPVLAFDRDGNLYGTYSQLYSCAVACGAVFQLKNTGGTWTESRVFDFAGGGNGGNPMAGIIFDNEGNLYGTGSRGGNNWGMVFELKLQGSGVRGVMLHNFCSRNSCADGANPLAALVRDPDGALYGTTAGGGTGCFQCGLVFKLVNTKLGWLETVLHSFQGGPDGATPAQGVILGPHGNIYGVTSSNVGVTNTYGTVFEITP